jgi:hypothetical protein
MKISRPTLVVLLALGSAAAVQAKCNVTLELKNGNAKQVTALGSDSKSKVNGGTWSKMNFGNVAIPAGATRDVSWVTNMSCSGEAKRDLKIAYQEKGSNQTYEELKSDVNVEPGVAVQVTLKH